MVITVFCSVLEVELKDEKLNELPMDFYSSEMCKNNAMDWTFLKLIIMQIHSLWPAEALFL